jgi:hypothetical protein
VHLRFLNLIPDKPSNNENTSLGPDLRVQFLEVVVDEPLLAHFDELARGSVEEVALRFQRAEIYLTDYLDVMKLSLGKVPQFRNVRNLGSWSRMRALYGLALGQQKIEDILIRMRE